MTRYDGDGAEVEETDDWYEPEGVPVGGAAPDGTDPEGTDGGPARSGRSPRCLPRGDVVSRRPGGAGPG